VLDAIARQMPADGVLYLGGAETVLGLSNAFEALPGERGVYRRSKIAAATGVKTLQPVR
jgi:chemotaxis protein methyltransferase CheR